MNCRQELDLPAYLMKWKSSKFYLNQATTLQTFMENASSAPSSIKIPKLAQYSQSDYKLSTQSYQHHLQLWALQTVTMDIQNLQMYVLILLCRLNYQMAHIGVVLVQWVIAIFALIFSLYYVRTADMAIIVIFLFSSHFLTISVIFILDFVDIVNVNS